HLNPGGLATQWVPLYESDDATVKSEIATFFNVFPEGTIWSNDADGQGYDTVLVGQAEAAKIYLEEWQRRLDRRDHAGAAKSLRDVGFNGAMDLLATYAGRAADLKPWLESAEINRDQNLRLQYLAGMGLGANRSEAIHKEIMAYRRFPENLFVAS